MAVEFNADEIFEIAEDKEQDAAAFYHTAAQAVDYPAGKQLLEELAGWEEKHERLFSDLRGRLQQQHTEQTAFDPYGEEALYLRSLAQQSRYRAGESPQDIFGREPDFEQILDIAIDKEKDAITFYDGIQELVPEKWGKSEIQNIINEEKRHVRILSEELEKVRNS